MSYFRHLVVLTAASLLLAAGPGLRAAEAVMDYDVALQQATQVLRGGQPVAAESLFRAVLARYPGNPEVFAGLVDSLCRQSRYAEGLAAASAGAVSGNAELERQRHRCEFQSRLTAAQSQPAREADLASLRALHEEWADDPYTTGWLYARALEAQGQRDQAEALYGKLAERYPADGDFARQRDRLQSARQAASIRASLDDALREVSALEAKRDF
ncbi:MAG: Tetratricopeptide repeat, partial [Pseudomonadota bacterium]